MAQEHTQAEQPGADASAAGASDGNKKPSLWKRPAAVFVGTCVIAALFYLGLRYLADSYSYQSTDDAFLSADVVSIAPRVAGPAIGVFVDDNQSVTRGGLLVQIDPRDFKVQVEQKKAALASAEANVKVLLAGIELFKTEVASAESTAKQSEAEAAADEARANKAGADLARAEDLIRKKIISPQEYDAAKAAAVAAKATWDAGREKAASDRAKVTQSQAQLEAGLRAWERAQDQSKQTALDVDQAELNLSYTRLKSPVDGRVTRKAVAAGDYLEVGQRVLALVPAQVWVTANFKETQLQNIRTNQPVTIRIDSVPGTFSGHVDSIQAGSGAAFSLLPPENAVGNYVKVVQRVPVKIVFDPQPQTRHVLGPGMSVEPLVRVRGEISDWLVGIAAILLALIAGMLWWKAANRVPRTS